MKQPSCYATLWNFSLSHSATVSKVVSLCCGIVSWCFFFLKGNKGSCCCLTYIFLRPNYKETRERRKEKEKETNKGFRRRSRKELKGRTRKAMKESRDMTGLRKCASQPERKKSERKKEKKERKKKYLKMEERKGENKNK